MQTSEVLDYINENPCLLSRVYGYVNAGYFNGVNTLAYPDILNNPGALYGSEVLINDVIVSQLREFSNTNKKVRVLGIGEMLAMSFVKLAALHQDRIWSGELEFVATNLQTDFTIEKGIAEAKRRLAIFPSYEAYRDFDKTGLTDEQIDLLRKQRPILRSQNEVAFLEANHHLVRYVVGISSGNLFDDLRINNVLNSAIGGRFMLVHESFGGFRHADVDEKRTILQGLINVIHPEDGILMTSSDVISCSNNRTLNLLKEYGIRQAYNESIFYRHAHHYQIFTGKKVTLAQTFPTIHENCINNNY